MFVYSFIFSLDNNSNVKVGGSIPEFVLATGESVNITDAYQDPRFDPTVSCTHYFHFSYFSLWVSFCLWCIDCIYRANKPTRNLSEIVPSPFDIKLFYNGLETRTKRDLFAPHKKSLRYIFLGAPQMSSNKLIPAMLKRRHSTAKQPVCDG